MKKMRFVLLVLSVLMLFSCDRKPDLPYLDACARPDALKEIKYYVKHNISDAEGLLIAAEKNINEKIVNELLKSKYIGEKEKYDALWFSMDNKNIEVFKVILKATDGANIYEGNTNTTTMMRACEKGKTDIVKLLINAGADVNAQDKDSKTALIIACEKEDKDIVNALLAAGADVNAQDKDSKTALIIACEKEDKDIVNALLSAGADVNAQDKDSKTALIIACEKEDKDIVNALLSAGADMKVKTADGFTALVKAYKINNNEIKSILINAGADIKEIYEYCGIKMVRIPGKSFEMLATEVTQKLYEFIIGKNPSKFNGENLPVESVSWYDAVEFCNSLSKELCLTPVYTINGKNVTQNASANGYRLPTNEEYEYAAKGGEDCTYAGSNKIDEVAWYGYNSNYKTHPVAQKKANGYGLYDMSGNVVEWCWDVSPINDGNDRIMRGGAWSFYAIYCEVSCWSRENADDGFDCVGFRVVRNIE